MREIKFRVFDTEHNIFISQSNEFGDTMWALSFNGEFVYMPKDRIYKQEKWKIMQYTGLTDKQGVEIYEYMEIDNTYEVNFLNGCYVLINISKGDIITLYDYMEQRNGQVTVTKEYTKV